MIIRRTETAEQGLKTVVSLGKQSQGVELDFGILHLQKGGTYMDQSSWERAYLLVQGRISAAWASDQTEAERTSVLDEGPWVLHVPGGVRVEIEAASPHVELCVESVPNNTIFESRVFLPRECRVDLIGDMNTQVTAQRTVRTVFDGDDAPHSNMVLGEVVAHPGHWSSYPPHSHPQPELYHFRFFPFNGFGYSGQGNDVYKVFDGDTAVISGGLTHPQVAAPGYTMYYIWMIPHLPNHRFNSSSREYVKEHAWLMEQDAVVRSPQNDASLR